MEQIVVSKKIVNEEGRIARECRGRRLALLGSVFMIQNSNHGYYVKSESSKDRYYFVEYKENSGMQFCTCWDYTSNRADKCKHIFAVGYALRLNLVQKIDHKLPICQKPSPENFSGLNSESAEIISAIKTKSVAEQYKGLSIATLNEMEKAEIEAEAYRTKRQSYEDDTYDF